MLANYYMRNLIGKARYSPLRDVARFTLHQQRGVLSYFLDDGK